MSHCDLHFIWEPLQAISEVAIAIVALSGPWWFKLLESPKLKLSINDLKGDIVTDTMGGRQRWYHVKIKNERPRNVARKIAIYCVAIETKQADGQFKLEPIPMVRMGWPYEGAVRGMDGTEDFAKRNIGTEDLCDFGFALSNGKVSLALTIVPNRLGELTSKPFSIRVHLKAIGDNFESKRPLVVPVSWDGIWKEDGEEMSRHLTISEIRD